MFEWKENNYLTLVKREMQEKLELEKERKLNEELKQRQKRLEEENKGLREKFKQNQIEIITKKNDVNGLLGKLQREKRTALEQSQRLQISKEQIESIKNFIQELKPIKEQLSFKRNVTECLHDLLVKTKLRIAESDEILQQLHDYLTDLEFQVDQTRSIQRKGTKQWQDECLTARIREADVVLEFDKLKRDIAFIKHELEDKKLIREAIEMTSQQPSNKKNVVNKKDKMLQQILREEEIAANNVLQHQNEIDYLRIKIKQLEDQKEDCRKRLHSNEETKLNLHEVRRSIWLREFETNQKTESLKDNYKKLTEKLTEELEQIRLRIEEKDMAICGIEEKIKELHNRNTSLEENMEGKSDEDCVQELEQQKTILEQELVELKKN